MKVLITILCCFYVSTAVAAQSSELIREIEASERRQILEIACQTELNESRIPVACLKLGRETPDSLSRFCIRAASSAKTSEILNYSKEELRLLPKECLTALNGRLQDLVYKEQKSQNRNSF